MQNSIKILFFLFLFISETLAKEQFTFDVTKIEISLPLDRKNVVSQFGPLRFFSVARIFLVTT